MANPKHLQWKLFVFWLKENCWTVHNLAYAALVFYFSCCFDYGRWLIGPRIVNIAVLAYVVGVYCFSIFFLLWWKLTGKEDEGNE